jgi:hypothetical protein
MATVVAATNGGESLTLGQVDEVGPNGDGREWNVVGLPNDPLRDEIDDGRGDDA